MELNQGVFEVTYGDFRWGFGFQHFLVINIKNISLSFQHFCS